MQAKPEPQSALLLHFVLLAFLKRSLLRKLSFEKANPARASLASWLGSLDLASAFLTFSQKSQLTS
jgi:hypothetical protein